MKQVRLSYNLDFYSESEWLTVTALPAVRSSFAYVQELGDFHCGDKYYTKREYLPSYLIKLTQSGQGTLEYNHSVYQLRPGSLFWIDCRKLQHYYTAEESGRWHMLWVHFYGPTTRAYYESFLEQNANSPVISTGHDNQFIDILEKLIRLYSNKGTALQDDITASGLLTQLMVSCINAADKKRKITGQRSADYVGEIRNFIDNNYQDNISLDHLAQAFSINKYYLQKLFKKRSGLSPNEYLTRVRLEKAKNLLRTTDSTIIQIAQEVGYTASYFDNVFKKFEGVTPQTYRQRWYDSDTDL